MSLKKGGHMSTLKEALDFFDWFTSGRQIAFRDKIGGQEVMERILSDEYDVKIELIKKIRKLLDHTGRCIPMHFGIESNVCDENRNFHVEIPELSCAEIREQTAKFFPKETEFAEVSRFEDETATLKEKYTGHELVGNFFQRARRIVLPKHDVRKNYGASMQDFILPAVERAYKKSFPARNFVNYRKNDLVGNVSIIPGTGHDGLISLMSEKSVSAWYSPNPFQGFSIFAQREAMKILTQYGFALAGGIDTGVAIVAYVESMARDFNTPVCTCGAVSWRSAGYSRGFDADGGGFGFGSAGLLAGASGSDSGGLVLFR
jgi:hypothetical protein